MSEPYLGEIRMVGFPFAPRGWAFCQGQTLSISQNTALFSLLGTTYGGNGQTTFQLPDLRGRVPVGQGQGGTLQPVVIGEVGGNASTSLTIANMPAHTHTATLTPQINVTDTVGTLKTAGGNMLAQTPAAGQAQALIYAPANSPVSGQLAGVSGTGQIGITGNNLPIDNHPPYLGINFIIALQGVFPSRN